jgi:hypothetical protein
MFLSLSPFEYVQDGYILINVIPGFRHYRVLDDRISAPTGAYYSVVFLWDADDISGRYFDAGEPTESTTGGVTTYTWDEWADEDKTADFSAILERLGFTHSASEYTLDTSFTTEKTSVEYTSGANTACYTIKYFDGSGKLRQEQYRRAFPLITLPVPDEPPFAIPTTGSPVVFESGVSYSGNSPAQIWVWHSDDRAVAQAIIQSLTDAEYSLSEIVNGAGTSGRTIVEHSAGSDVYTVGYWTTADQWVWERYDGAKVE